MRSSLRDKCMARDIAKRVDKQGGRTFYVGGYVRDEILHKSSKDVDIEVHGVTPDELKGILMDLGQLRTQGASFGVYNLEGYDIDIAQPRKETATGRGHKDFEVFVDPFIGYEKAAERRDFTMNAMMKDVLTGEIVDPFGGYDDCKNGIIRHVNDNTFKEDPLRVLRAAQFASRFGFEIAPETKYIMQDMDLSTLSQERVYGEMKKALMKSDKPSIFFETLRDVNQLDTWFPELKPMIGCEQSPIWHPEGDVWNHTMATINYAVKFRDKVEHPEYYMVSALCHDMGKPVSVSKDDKGNIHTYSHDENGVPIVTDFLARINNDKSLSKYVIDMTANHMKPHDCFDNHSKVKSTNAMYDRSICPSDLMMLAVADTASRGLEDVTKEEESYLKERLELYTERMLEPQVGGADLIALGIKPGPQFSDILANAHKQHLSGQDKEKVLKGIKTIYCKQSNRVTELSDIVVKNDNSNDLSK